MLSVHYMVANVIAWVIAVAFAYVTNKLWVFESKSWARSVWIPECIGFVSARLATGLLDMGLMYLMICHFVKSILLFRKQHSLMCLQSDWWFTV